MHQAKHHYYLHQDQLQRELYIIGVEKTLI